jgi:mRNA interferase MazF
MKKDFQKWHIRKTWVNNEKPRVFFNVRDVWWCSIGSNVGFEQDGKGGKFARPVVIFRKFNNEIFWALPLTTKSKTGKYYLSVDVANIGKRTIILSQIRLVDAKRLLGKIGLVEKTDYAKIQKAIMSLCES